MRISTPGDAAMSHHQLSKFEYDAAPSEMVPDSVPDVGLQPDAHVPPHVRVACLLSLNVPAGHCAQTLAAEAPVAAWNRPGPQSVQELAPAAAAYVLAPQLTHGPGAGAGL